MHPLATASVLGLLAAAMPLLPLPPAGPAGAAWAAGFWPQTVAVATHHERCQQSLRGKVADSARPRRSGGRELDSPDCPSLVEIFEWSGSAGQLTRPPSRTVAIVDRLMPWPK